MHLQIGVIVAVLVIACAFGQQVTNTAGPSNEAIGRVALEIKRQEIDAVLSTQWEVEAYLGSIGEHADYLVSRYQTDSHYTTTEQVFSKSLAFGQTIEASKVVVVAQPMHLLAIRFAMKDWDIDPNLHFKREYDYLMRQIPFDRSTGNQQAWTRGPIRFGTYLMRAKLFGIHGQ